MDDSTFPFIVECLASLKKKRLTKSRVPPPEPPPACRLTEKQRDLLNRAIEAWSKIDHKSPVGRSTIEQVKETNALWNEYAPCLTPSRELAEELWRRAKIDRAWKQQ
jgi:hypothetical protein